MQQRKPTPKELILVAAKAKEQKQVNAANLVTISSAVTGLESPRTQAAIADFMFNHGGNFRLWYNIMAKQQAASTSPKQAPSSSVPAKK